MFALAPTMFDYFGLQGLTRSDKNEILRGFYKSLELTVGIELAGSLTAQQLDDFEEIIEYLQHYEVSPEDDPSLAWLESVRPDYRDVVAVWIVKHLQEIYDKAGRIAEIAGIELGRVSSDPVSETLDHMQVESRRIAGRRALGA